MTLTLSSSNLGRLAIYSNSVVHQKPRKKGVYDRFVNIVICMLLASSNTPMLEKLRSVS